MIRRPDWEETFLLETISAGLRASCLKRRVGAILARDKRVVAKGYNGAPRKVETCLDVGECYYERLAWEDHLKGHGDFPMLKEARKQFCNAVHAEQNAVNQCGLTGVNPTGASLYTSNFPCPGCVKNAIIPNKIVEVVVWKPFLSDLTLTADELTVSKFWLGQAGIPIREISINPERLAEILGSFSTVGDKTKYVFKP